MAKNKNTEPDFGDISWAKKCEACHGSREVENPAWIAWAKRVHDADTKEARSAEVASPPTEDPKIPCPDCCGHGLILTESVYRFCVFLEKLYNLPSCSERVKWNDRQAR